MCIHTLITTCGATSICRGYSDLRLRMAFIKQFKLPIQPFWLWRLFGRRAMYFIRTHTHRHTHTRIKWHIKPHKVAMRTTTATLHASTTNCSRGPHSIAVPNEHGGVLCCGRMLVCACVNVQWHGNINVFGRVAASQYCATWSTGRAEEGSFNSPNERRHVITVSESRVVGSMFPCFRCWVVVPRARARVTY